MTAASTHMWVVTSLLRTSFPLPLARRAGDRLLTLVAGLGPQDQAELRLLSTGDGSVDLALTIASDIPDLDGLVAWVWEDIARLERRGNRPRATPSSQLSELTMPARGGVRSVWDEFEERDDARTSRSSQPWPEPAEGSGIGLLQALRSTRAEVRLHLAPVNEMAADMVSFEWRGTGQDPQYAYLGTPLAARLFVAHDGPLSPRLRAALLGQGRGLRLVSMDSGDPAARSAWEGETRSLCAAALPFGAARCLTVTPAAGSVTELCGVPVVHPPLPLIPIADDVCRDGLRLGSAMSSNGLAREVRLSVEELLLHAQVVGSTGTGKSTLLAGLVRSAMDAGFGVSVIDPHGQLVDRLLAETPEAQAHAVVAVRSGDAEHPIPLNLLAGADPHLAVDTLVSVLRELHDPRNQGFLGPVWERWFAILIAVQRAVIADRANLVLLPELVTDQRRLRRIAESLRGLDPSLAGELDSIALRKPEEYADVTTWIAAKFQRMLGPVMRGILGSGRDAVDVVDIVDRGGALFVDLAAPEVGELGAQLLGEMWLVKHWEALTRRRDRSKPHLLIVDEAHLFASGLLPRLLTQARKYGVGLVLAHQNLEQLTPHLREAVLSSTNNVFVFRTGIREANAAEERLGRWGGGALTRLARLTAAVTVNTGDGFTEPFTLRVDHNERCRAADASRAMAIERRSCQRFGLRRADEGQLSAVGFEQRARGLKHVATARPDGPSYLDELARRKAAMAPATQE